MWGSLLFLYFKAFFEALVVEDGIDLSVAFEFLGFALAFETAKADRNAFNRNFGIWIQLAACERTFHDFCLFSPVQ